MDQASSFTPEVIHRKTLNRKHHGRGELMMVKRIDRAAPDVVLYGRGLVPGTVEQFTVSASDLPELIRVLKQARSESLKALNKAM